MTIDERARRVIDAIEATPDAVEARTAALAALIAGDMDRVVALCRRAAEAVTAAHPDAARELIVGVPLVADGTVDPAIMETTNPASALQIYIARQVRALAAGDVAVMDLRAPLD
jgi:protein-tyrosine-phosphatase